MNLFLLITSALWWLRIVGNLLAYIHLWWVKENRLDRMIVHLKTQQGKRLLFMPWRLPHLSFKSVLVGLVTLGMLIAFYLMLPGHPWLRLLVIDLATFLITALVVFVIGLPQALYHRLIIYLATRKLRNHRPMLVIGITGSFGKTSVKDYSATILSTQFRVLKTEASKNSPIGIAEVILRKLDSTHEIFIVEMGAYKKGEIRQMAQMVLPQIGVITAINAQHQDLFGTIENTMRAKYELLQNLTGKRLAILNADNEFTRTMGKWARRDRLNLWWYGPDTWDKVARPTERMFLASRVSASSDKVKFTCQVGREKATVSVPVLGAHQASNLLAAIATSVAAGMALPGAAGAAGKIIGSAKVMQPVAGVNGALFINDTFNNNPDAAVAALKFLSLSKGKKILVFQPMIELGNYSRVSHEKVGEYAANVCDEIILTNRNFYADVERGINRARRHIPLNILSAGEAAARLSKLVGKGDTVLFKGKEAEQVLMALRKN